MVGTKENYFCGGDGGSEYSVDLNEIHISCRMCLSMYIKRFIQL
jgi:hypothetical protein